LRTLQIERKGKHLVETIQLDANISWINLLIFKKTISKVPRGNRIQFNVSDLESAENLATLVKRSHDKLLDFTNNNNSFQLIVEKAEE